MAGRREKFKTEKQITVQEARVYVKKMGVSKPATSTILRWCQLGLGGTRLECARQGNKYTTSKEAIDRFLSR